MTFRTNSLAALILLAGLGTIGCTTSDSTVGFNGGSSPPNSGNPGLGTVVPRAAAGALVFAANGGLQRVDRNGSNPQTLTSGFNDSEPSFHPGGLNVVFSRERSAGGKQHIFSIAPDGSNPIDLTPDLVGDAFSPYYAWDGAFILFALRTGDSDQRIFVMNPDGSGRRELTSGGFDGHPAASGDGKFVVFERETSGGHAKICRLSLESGVINDLSSGNFSDRTPSYCPPSDTVIFTRDGDLLQMSDTRTPGQLNSLFPADVDTSYPRNSVEHDSIFFLSNGDLFEMNREGTDRTLLARGLGAQSLAVGPRGAASPAPNEVTVQVVNDSGLSDDDVFVMLDTPEATGQIVTGPPTLITNSGSTSVSGTAVPLSTLTKTGQFQQSTDTGNSLPIYALKVHNLKSGRFSFSYNTPGSQGPVAIVNGASPTANAPYRYDKMELTYLRDNKSGGGNLTAIDFFGIPLRVDVTHWNQTQIDPLQTKTFYASTPTLINTVNALSGSMGKAFQNVSGTQFSPGSNLSSFARILSPNTLAAENGNNGSPAPYPSFKNYLTSLVGQSFPINGSQQGGYNYTATVASDGAGGFVINCVGTLNVPAPSPLPNNANVTVLLPAGSMDFFIYACVANMNSYSVAGFPFNGNQDNVNLANSSAYGALVGDLQAALNFGYMGGRFGTNIDSFYAAAVLPYAYPFAGARTINDGFYNAFAGIFYYLSDAYGHPYSDRLSAASPLYNLAAGDTVQITLLNDNRLDSPLVKVASATDTSLNLSWPAVTGATGYKINVSPPPLTPLAPVVVSGNPQTYSLTGLEAGTPYLVGVTATGNNIQSETLPVQGITTGTRAPLNKTGGPTFQANVNLPAALTGYQIFVNGTQVSPTANASISGALGTNVFGLQIKQGGNVVYDGNYVVETIAASSGAFTLGPFVLQYNLTPLTQAGPPGTPPYPNGSFQCVIGTPFNPKPFYQFFQSVFP